MESSLSLILVVDRAKNAMKILVVETTSWSLVFLPLITCNRILYAIEMRIAQRLRYPATDTIFTLGQLFMMFFKFLDPSSSRAGKMRMEVYNLPCLILFIVFNTHLNYFGSANVLSPDGAALLEMKSYFSVPLHVLSSWRNDSSSDVNHCSWEGVHCSSYGRRVTSISLPHKGLSGRLSSAIGKIAALEKLDLSGNRLSGTVPTQIANCTELRELNLANNFFTGFIPPEISNCSLLTVLNMSTNNISGIIPPAVGNLIRLTTLALDTNNLNGIIPSSIGNLANIDTITAYSNNFNGSLPPEIGNCSRLRISYFDTAGLQGKIPREIGNLKNIVEMTLFGNYLTGTIPSSIGNCSRLEAIAVYKNSLEGTIPWEIALLENLRDFWVYENHLTGSIPRGFFNRLPKLEAFAASYNNLSGVIPYEMGNLKNLRVLHLQFNNMSGSIPSSFANLTNLQVLSLSSNNFDGTLPEGLGLLPNLVKLLLSDNMFKGPLPPALGMLSNLELLDSWSSGLKGSIPSGLCSGKSLTRLAMFDNRLEGNITSLLQDCVSLQRVRLQNNLFTGFIPSNISMLSALYYLEISYNNIHGSIPSSIGRLQNLTNLLLAHNNLSGAIPPEIGELRNLGKLNLSRNNLSGTIPPEVGNLISLEVLDLSGNSLEGSIPAALGHLMNVLTLNLSVNALTGRIPSSLGYCRQLSELYLARNKLSMTIPMELGKLAASLRYGLDLSWNNLSGSIPPLIGNLRLLESLDLSHNRLSGNIPQSLTDMISLDHFNFSFNLFTGTIPSLRAFSQGPQNAFEGNPGICGPPTRNNCSDSEVAGKKKEISSADVAGITVACIGTIAILMLALLYILKRSRPTSERHNEEEDGQPGIIKYRDIVEATDNFSDDYVIGSGASGMVYKVVIPGRDKILAAKCLKLANHHHDNIQYRSLRHEIESLKHARHRNILRHRDLITEHDGTNKVIVLLCDYMVNGSLWEYLGGASKRPNQSLDWRTRYNIAVGVAEGLKYLHHDCEPPIIHCDIKSANILLDDEYVAHIADFGLARLVRNSSIDSESSSLLGGTHGYIAPECGHGVKASTKQDVYSFGVVLLEMVSGKHPVVEEDGQEFVHLSAWAAKKGKEGRMDEIIDKDLRSSSDYNNVKDEIRKMMEIATFCTRSAPNLRPSMNIVLGMFNRPQSDHYLFLPSETEILE